MSDYKYDNPDDAYHEALRRIKKAKDDAAIQSQIKCASLSNIWNDMAKCRNWWRLLGRNGRIWTCRGSALCLPPEGDHKGTPLPITDY
jgi:hypothetical protein